MGSQERKKETNKLYQSASHEHPLELKNFLKPYICDGCKEHGFGSRYRCQKCNFELHEQCMFPQTSPTSHEFFPKATFKFLKTQPKACHPGCKKECDACGMTIHGFLYHCEKRRLDLHPCCRELKRKFHIETEESELEFNLHKNVKDKCFLCNKKRVKEGGRSRGWSYISKCGKLHVHVACVSARIFEDWNDKMRLGDSSWGLQTINLKEIQAQGNGGSGNKVWKILKLLLSTIVSIVLGDPTMICVSLFMELLK